MTRVMLGSLPPAAKLSILLLAAGRLDADPFVNLGFEQANTKAVSIPGPGVQGGYGPTSEMLPGWELLRNGKPVQQVGLDQKSLAFGEAGGATLLTDTGGVFPLFPTEGKFSLQL